MFGAFDLSGLLSGLHDGNLLAILTQTLKLDAAVHLGEQGVIAADAHVDAGMDMGAALADQNVSGQHKLTVSPLHAQPLRLRVAAIPGGTHALLMREELERNLQHCFTPP